MNPSPTFTLSFLAFSTTLNSIRASIRLSGLTDYGLYRFLNMNAYSSEK